MYTPLPSLITWMLMAHRFSTQALSHVPDLYNHRNIPLASQIQQVQIIPLLSFLISTNGITIYLSIQTGKRQLFPFFQTPHPTRGQVPSIQSPLTSALSSPLSSTHCPKFYHPSLGTLCLSIAIEWTHIHSMHLIQLLYPFDQQNVRNQSLHSALQPPTLLLKLDFDLNCPRKRGPLQIQTEI